ncbi:MAG: DUF222 domain-containing protein [Nocardioides sp.]
MASTVGTTDRGHPISAAVARMQAEVGSVAEQPAWSLGAEETRATLCELTRLAAQVAELELRVVAHADRVRVGDESGATSTANWWAHTTKITRREAHHKVRLAHSLEDHEALRTDLANGMVLPEQAQVIAEALDALPGELVDAATLELAEKTLLTYAADHDAKGLRVLARRILDVVAPEIGETHTARQLEQEERDAEAAARFTMSEDGHGKCHGRFTLPALRGAMLSKALNAIAAPKHQAATDGQTPVPGRASAQRLGRAFCEYVERYPVDALPKAGGVSATVVVTMPLDALLGGLQAAHLDTGQAISASLARRLACAAGIIPAVLGSRSQVLDLGRKTRFHTEPQRIALGIEQGGCTAEACDWPPGMCHAHHDLPWSKGGHTSVKDGRLLCPRHHARAHDPTYTTTKLPGGKAAFHRRV